MVTKSTHLKYTFKRCVPVIAAATHSTNPSEQTVLDATRKMHQTSVSAKRAILPGNFTNEPGPVPQAIHIIKDLWIKAPNPSIDFWLHAKAKNWRWQFSLRLPPRRLCQAFLHTLRLSQDNFAHKGVVSGQTRARAQTSGENSFTGAEPTNRNQQDRSVSSIRKLT